MLEYYVRTTFTPMLQDGLLVLAAPNFRNRSKKCPKKNLMFFWRVFLHVCEEEGGTYYKSSSMKFIEEPPSIVSIALHRTTNLNDTEFLKFSKTKGWKFTKTIITFVLFSYLPSRIQHGLMKSLLNIILRTLEFKMAAVSAKWLHSSAAL